MKKALLFWLLPAMAFGFEPVQNTLTYQVQIDLIEMHDEQVNVQIVVPILEQDEVIYNMPKIVPGTYSIYNYGQFVHQLKAFDGSGDALPVLQINTNQWKIERAKELYKVEYWVSDSYHNKTNLFAPAGTAISEEAFLLNNFGFVGYLEGLKNLPYQLDVRKKDSFYGATSLPVASRTDSLDAFTAESYFQLHDCPILYAEPDTASIMVAGIPVTIAVYSPEGHIKAKEVRDAVTPVFAAAADYLGGDLPAKQYAVLIYGQTLQQAMAGSGALEHHTSTVLNVPDVRVEVLKMFSEGDPMQIYRDIVAHEFFHIVTPLNIHAKQISDYDFINPQMSEHLWLYEGVTEYNSMIAQLRGGVLSMDEFIGQVKDKIQGARQYDQTIPFTQMSKYALSFFSDQYHNVYQQGALIGLAVDLKLHTLSNGEYGLNNLLHDLWNTYGADTFFVDDELFGLMAEKSFPEMEEFLVRHIAGTEPLPLEELLDEVGITYIEEKVEITNSTGGMRVAFHPKNKEYIIVRFDEDSEFAQDLGIEKYDVLKQWGDAEINEKTDMKAVFDDYRQNAKVGKKLTVVVQRLVDGNPEKIKLKTTVIKEKRVENDVFTINESLTDKQRTLRDLWINN